MPVHATLSLLLREQRVAGLLGYNCVHAIRWRRFHSVQTVLGLNPRYKSVLLTTSHRERRRQGAILSVGRSSRSHATLCPLSRTLAAGVCERLFSPVVGRPTAARCCRSARRVIYLISTGRDGRRTGPEADPGHDRSPKARDAEWITSRDNPPLCVSRDGRAAPGYLHQLPRRTQPHTAKPTLHARAAPNRLSVPAHVHAGSQQPQAPSARYDV